MEEYIAGPQLVVQPKVAPAALRLLETERARYVDDGDPLSPEYAESVQRLIDAVTTARPIDMSAHMTEEERLASLEFGRDLGTVEQYLMGTIGYAFEGDLTGATAQDWRYLSDVAALGADVEAAMLAQV
jgi:hypothetical protein